VQAAQADHAAALAADLKVAAVSKAADLKRAALKKRALKNPAAFKAAHDNLQACRQHQPVGNDTESVKHSRHVIGSARFKLDHAKVFLIAA
jgi:hypothetical protein